MTPTARIEFFYEFTLLGGTKIRGVNFRTANGGWEASQLIKDYKLKPPSSTTILNGKEYIYKIDNLPYNIVRGESAVIAYFNNPRSYIDQMYPYDLPIIDVHLVFKRVKK